MKIISFNNIDWIDIEKPKEKDLAELKEKYNLHPFIAKQFLPTINRPKIEEYPSQLFMVLHFPVFHPKTKQTIPEELDVIIMDHTLITSHQNEIPALKIFFDDCNVQDYHKNQYFKSVGSLLFGLLDFLIDSCLPMLDHVGDNIEKIEKKVFGGHEKEMVSEIAFIKKDLIDIRRAIKPQKPVLEVLEKKSRRLFGLESRRLSQEMLGSNLRVWNILENQKDLIESIEETNNSLLSYKLNEIMKVLTIVSFIFFPLSVIVGFFGMNVFDNIELISSNDFAWIFIFFLVVFTGMGMYIYFKVKKWL
jgi:magnesium transporter